MPDVTDDQWYSVVALIEQAARPDTGSGVIMIRHGAGHGSSTS